MWGKTELKKGQIGKITVTKPINLWERDANNKLSFERVLKPGEEYRVYRYDNLHGGQYGLGGGMYITKMPTHIKYETPSKAKLALLENESKKVTPVYSSIDDLLENMRDYDTGFWLESDEGYTLVLLDTFYSAMLQYKGWGEDRIEFDINPTSDNSATFSYYYLEDDKFEYKTYNDGVLKLVDNELHITFFNYYEDKRMTVKVPVTSKIGEEGVQTETFTVLSLSKLKYL